VTSVAGTTRDVLELALDVGGLPVRVADTAGLRDTPDAVERIGVARAREAVERADIALCVLAADELRDDPGGHLRDVAPLIGPETLVLVNKTDMVSEPALGAVPRCAGVFAASVATGAGMPAFVDGLARALRARFDPHAGTGGDAPLLTRARHRVHFERAAEFLDAFLACGACALAPSAAGVGGADG
jgi:tRNA modification GTPase